MFNVSSFIYSLLAVLAKEVKADWDIVKGTAERYFFIETKARLQAVAEGAINGSLTPKEVENILKRELEVLEVQLLSLEVITKSMAQEAINSVLATATGLLSSFVKEVIPPTESK